MHCPAQSYPHSCEHFCSWSRSAGDISPGFYICSVSHTGALPSILSDILDCVQHEFACSKWRRNETNISVNICSRVKRSRSQIKKVKPLLLGWIPSVSQKFQPFHLGIMPYLHQDGGENWPPPIGQSHIIIWTANNVKRTWFKRPVGFYPHFCLIYCSVSGWRAPIKFAKLRGAKVGSVSDHPHFGCRQHQLLARHTK